MPEKDITKTNQKLIFCWCMNSGCYVYHGFDIETQRIFSWIQYFQNFSFSVRFDWILKLILSCRCLIFEIYSLSLRALKSASRSVAWGDLPGWRDAAGRVGRVPQPRGNAGLRRAAQLLADRDHGHGGVLHAQVRR